MTNKHGFTLIELLVVTTIMIVLMAVGAASFSAAAKSARDAKRRSDVETIRQALVLYKSQYGSYPAGAATTVVEPALMNGNFISRPFPRDPVANTTYQVYSTTATTFCLCANLEITTKGNHSTNENCNGTWTTTGQPYYCVKQP